MGEGERTQGRGFRGEDSGDVTMGSGERTQGRGLRGEDSGEQGPPGHPWGGEGGTPCALPGPLSSLGRASFLYLLI